MPPRLPRYEILAELGQGGMSVVYRARDTQLPREVAVKVLHEFMARDPDARLRFDAIAAADANGDREVTLDELGAVQLTTLPMTQYSTGPLPNVRTLRDFVTHLVSTVGHFNGEGHCQERRS